MEKVGHAVEIRKFLEGICRGAAERIAEHPVAEVDGLDAVVREVVLEVGARVHGFVASQVGRGLRAEAPTCPDCGEEMTFKQNRPVRIRSVLTGGAASASGPYFLCWGCGVGASPLRDALGLDSEGFTPALREVCVRAGALEPFESASESVLSAIGSISVSGSKIHELSLRAGEAALDLLERGEAGDSRPLRKDERLIVEIDGGMLRVDGEWREAKLATAYPADSATWVTEKRRELLLRRHAGDIGDPDSLRTKLLPMVASFLPTDADGAPVIAGRVHVVADGAPWIENLVRDELPGASMVLDWYHVVEHVAAATKASFDSESQAKRARTTWLRLIKSGAADRALIAIARASMRRPAGSTAHRALADLHRYLDDRRHLLDYPSAIVAGLPIGSGAAESAIKHVLQIRMKRPGMRWSLSGARAIAALRCAYRSTAGLDAVFAAQRKAA